MKKKTTLFVLTPLFALSFVFAPPSGKVTHEQFGEAWPLTVDSGVLECRGNKEVVFIHEGTTYAVNGNASSKYTDIEPIWRDDPSFKDIPLENEKFIKKI